MASFPFRPIEQTSVARAYQMQRTLVLEELVPKRSWSRVSYVLSLVAL